MARPPDATTRLILVLGLGCLASTLATRALDPLVGVLALEFGTTAATVALLGTAFALPYALVQPVLGPVGDAVGKQRVIRVCLLVLAAALLASALVPGLAGLAGLRMLAGAAAGGIFPLCIAIIGDRVPMERRQVALSRLLVAGLTGSAGGGAMAALLEPFIGWRGVVLICAAASVAGFLVLRGAEAAPHAAPGRRLDMAEALTRYRHLLALRQARRLYLAVFVEGTLVFGVFPFLAPILAARSIGGPAEAGLAIAGFAAGGFGFAALAPMLLGRLGQARMVVLGGVLAACGLGGLALAPAAWLVVACCLTLGLGFYMVHSSIQTRVTEVAPMARGSAVALHAFCFFLGQSLGPVAMGLARAGVGQEWALALAAAGMLALAAWLGPQRAGRSGMPAGR
ncbi:MFS transporter [Falsiroseomonas sp. CW058]|uniref:MFS transporter n=1 Tax=Falsiroseomonas sp. CW058 TaxID=3388664 RepID=UPI003D31055C